MRHAACLFLLIVAVGCENDEKKLARLQSEQVMACLTAQVDSAKVADARSKAETTEEYRRRMDAGRSLELIEDTTSNDAAHQARAKKAGVDALTEQWLAQIRRCELSTRDYNRFLR
jgi:predicted outer membrane protein